VSAREEALNSVARILNRAFKFEVLAALSLIDVGPGQRSIIPKPSSPVTSSRRLPGSGVAAVPDSAQVPGSLLL